MYFDEGPSAHPPSPSRHSASIDLEAMEESSQVEDNVPHEMTEFEIGVSPPSPALKSRPLTLFDNYEIVGGVPTFVLRRERDDDWHCNPMGLSSDGSRIALATESTTVCVYDLLDGCSLIAKKEDISTGSIGFLSFWNNRNDQLVVFDNKDRKVFFFSIIENSSTSDERAMSKIGKLKELKEQQVYNVKHNIDKSRYLLMNVFADTSTFWIARKSYLEHFMHMTRITREQCQHVELREPRFSLSDFGKITVRTDVVSIQYLSTDMPYMNKTVLFNVTDFGNESMQAKTIVIQGECIALNGFGQHMLFWKFGRDGQSQLNLYSKYPAKLDASKPITCFNLGNGVMTVSAISLDRRTWTFNNMSDDGPHPLPLICVLRVQQSNSDVLVWDADLDKVLTRIEVPIKEDEYDADSWFGISASPDGKWLAILDNSCRTISLYSFFSGVQVWQTSLDTRIVQADYIMPLSFNALSTTLVVNCPNKVYVFVPPCLIKDYILNGKCVESKIDFKSNPDLDEEVFSIVRENQLQTVSSSVLDSESLLNLCFQQIDDEHIYSQLIRVANPFLTSKMAIIIHKDTCFLIILASLREICSSNFVHLVVNLLQGRNVEHEFQEIQIKEDLAEEFRSPLNIECIVLYPNKRQSNDSIAILRTDGVLTNAIFINPNDNSQELICLETGTAYEYVQSKEGLKVMCLKEDSILIVDLEQKQIEHVVHYQVNFLKWINIHYREKKLTIMDLVHLWEIDNEYEYYSRYLHQSKALAPPQIANDGKSILLGWSVGDQKPAFITHATNDQNVKSFDSIVREKKIFPCWALDGNFQKFSFIEFDEDWRHITSIGTYSNKDNKCERFLQDDWTPQVKRVLMNIDFTDSSKCNMLLHECNGCLKLLVVRSYYHRNDVYMLPMTPYSMNRYLPCLHSLDSPSKSYSGEDLDKFVFKFSTSFFNMPLNEKTNLHTAIEHGDVDMIKALTNSAYRNNTLLGINCSQASSTEPSSNLLDVAIQKNSEDVLIAILDIFKKKQIPFIYGANAIEETFQSFWRSNQAVFEELLLDNTLCWEISTLDVPSHILNNKAYEMDRVGAFDDLLINRSEGNIDIITNVRKSSNKLGVKLIHQRAGDPKVKAIIKVVCFGNIAKMGSQGILRFLILQQAPAYIFKTSIVK